MLINLKKIKNYLVPKNQYKRPNIVLSLQKIQEKQQY